MSDSQSQNPNPDEEIDVNALLAQIETLVYGENSLEAFEPLREVLQREAGNPWAWFYLGELARLQGQFESAHWAFSLGLSRHPLWAKPRLSRASTLALLHRYDESLDDLHFLLRERLVASTNDFLLWVRSDCLASIGRVQWALDDLNELLTHYPNDATARNARDEMLRQTLKDSELAQAIRAQIEALEAHQNLEEGASDDDLPPLDAQFEERPISSLAFQLIYVLENAARESEGDEWLRHLIDHYDEDSFGCVNIAEILWRRRDLTRARYWANRALALAPSYGGAHFLLGKIESEINRRAQTPEARDHALSCRVQGAHFEYEPALEWIQNEWKARFEWLGEIVFSPLQRQKNADPLAQEFDAPPTSTDWDGVMERFKRDEENEE